jgi:hypothetical protein
MKPRETLPPGRDAGRGLEPEKKATKKTTAPTPSEE